jgi:hypothetical protein
MDEFYTIIITLNLANKIGNNNIIMSSSKYKNSIKWFAINSKSDIIAL